MGKTDSEIPQQEMTDIEASIIDLSWQIDILREVIRGRSLTTTEKADIRNLIVGLARATGMAARPRIPIDPAILAGKAINMAERWSESGRLDDRTARKLWRAVLRLSGLLQGRDLGFITPETAVREFAGVLDIAISRRAPRLNAASEVRDLSSDLLVALITTPVEERAAVATAFTDYVVEPGVAEIGEWAQNRDRPTTTK